MPRELSPQEQYAELIMMVRNSKDINTKNKLLILLSLIDLFKDQGKNLLYLECVNLIKELKDNDTDK